MPGLWFYHSEPRTAVQLVTLRRGCQTALPEVLWEGCPLIPLWASVRLWFSSWALAWPIGSRALQLARLFEPRHVLHADIPAWLSQNSSWPCFPSLGLNQIQLQAIPRLTPWSGAAPGCLQGCPAPGLQWWDGPCKGESKGWGSAPGEHSPLPTSGPHCAPSTENGMLLLLHNSCTYTKALFLTHAKRVSIETCSVISVRSEVRFLL